MTTEQFNREARYGTAMATARSMHARGIISEGDYLKIETIFRAKYRPIFSVVPSERMGRSP
jgi:hypothetical protein